MLKAIRLISNIPKPSKGTKQNRLRNTRKYKNTNNVDSLIIKVC